MTRRICGIALAAALLTTAVAEAGPSPAVPMRATVSGSLSGGPFEDSVDSVRCVFFDPDQGGSGHFRLDTYQAGLGPKPPSKRTIDFTFPASAEPAACDCTAALPPANGPRETNIVISTVDASRNFYQLRVEDGEQDGWAVVYVSDGNLKFAAPGSQNWYCSTPVKLRRTGPDSWSVSASGTAALVVSGRRGEPVCKGRYSMGFSISIQRKSP